MGNLFSSASEEDLIIRKQVSSNEVYNTLNDLVSYFVILDIRSAASFKQSHMDLALNPTCLQDMLYHAKQSPYTTVIVYGDCNDKKDESIISSFCFHMSRHRSKQHEGPLQVLHLQDFASFYADYPFHCTNTSFYEEGRLYPSQITSNIFLSNFGVASSKKVINTLGITHILNCTKDCPFVGQAMDVADSAQALNAAINSFETVPLPLSEECTLNCKEEQLIGDSGGRSAQVILARIPVVDDKDQQIHEHFCNAIQFLSAMGSSGRAIIHCKHGQSRSATIAAAYLIKTNGWSVDQAIAHLKACRPKVCPNEGFIAQLREFADQCNNNQAN